MDRKDFLKNCGMTCLGFASVPLIFQGCGLSKSLTGKIDQSDLIVSLSDFQTNTGEQIHYKKYIVVNNEEIKFPICIFRETSTNYTAIWLQCSHQGAELQVFGDKLQCPAHGSEFNREGIVTNGPASNNLRTFPVTVAKNELRISLKAV